MQEIQSHSPEVHKSKALEVNNFVFRLGKVSLAKLGQVMLGQVRLGLVWFGLVRFGQVWLGLVRFVQVCLGQVRLGQVRLGQVRLGQFRLGQVRLGQVRLGMRCARNKRAADGVLEPSKWAALLQYIFLNGILWNSRVPFQGFVLFLFFRFFL